MQIYKLSPIGFAANTYFLTADGEHALVIDPAQPRVLEEAERLKLKIEYVLLTHGHFDHIGGCAALQSSGAKIGCLSGEEAFATRRNLGREFGAKVPPFSVDFTVKDGEELILSGLHIKVLATPGHTAGSACYLATKGDERALFTGDTLFQGSVGRTDLPTGSGRALAASLKKLCALPFDCPVYAGHGEDSTLAYEKTHNGYLKC